MNKTTTIIKLITKWSKEHLEMLDKRYPNLKYLNKKHCEFVKSLLNDNSDGLAKEQLNKKGAKKRKIKIQTHH